MNKLDINSLKMHKDFIVIDNENIKVIFSTAEEGKSFNRHTKDGVNTLNSLKDEFKVEDVVYIRQIHSDFVYLYDGKDRENFIENEGDAIITKIKNTAIGVFTADCVPVILVDDKNNAVAAIHSGWKGTFKSITKETIEKMEKEFGTNPNNIKAYIGAHIRQCCYEVSEELKEKFINEKSNIDKEILFKGRNLNMEACILDDLRRMGVKEENINSLNLCTHCTDKIKLHSYRKSNGAYGRLFAFVIIK